MSVSIHWLTALLIVILIASGFRAANTVDLSAKAVGLHRPQYETVYGPVAWRSDQQIHAVVDSSGLPVRLALTTGEAHDSRLTAKLLSRPKSGSMLLADRGYDADWI